MRIRSPFISRSVNTLEQYTRTDLRYLLRGGSYLAAGNITQAIAAMVLTVAYANLIPPDVYGTYKFLLSIGTLLALPCLSGISTALIKSVSNGHDGTLHLAMRIRFRWGAWSLIAAIGGSLYYLASGALTLAVSMIVLGLTVPLIQVVNLYTSLLHGKQKYKLLSITLVAHQVLLTGALVLAMFMSNDTLILILTYFMSELIIHSALFYYVKKYVHVREDVDEKVISYGKQLSQINVFATLGSHFDKVILFGVLGPSSLALYSFATAPVSQLMVPFKIISTLALPRFSSRNYGVVRKTLPRKIGLLYFLSVICILAYVLFAPTIFHVLFPKYVQAIPYTQVYACILFASPGVILSQLLVAHARVKAMYVSKIFLPICTIVLLLILLPPLGIWGAVIGVVASHIAHSLLLLLMFYKT